MQGMDRTRIIFIVIIGVAVLAVCGILAGSLGSRLLSGDDATPTGVATTQASNDRPTPSVNLE